MIMKRNEPKLKISATNAPELPFEHPLGFGEREMKRLKRHPRSTKVSWEVGEVRVDIQRDDLEQKRGWIEHL